MLPLMAWLLGNDVGLKSPKFFMIGAQEHLPISKHSI